MSRPLNTDWVIETERFIYEGLALAYPGGGIYIPAGEHLPGHKIFTHKNGRDKVLTDTFCVNSQTGLSAGETIVYIDGEAVWKMVYGGHYDPSAINFLKEVLLNAYRSRIFCAFRGEKFTYNHIYTYVNIWETGSNFHRFAGNEYIFRHGDKTEAGHHWYSGHSL